MEPELKTYLDKQFETLASKADLVVFKEDMSRQLTEVHSRFDSTHEQLVLIREEMATKEDLTEQIDAVNQIGSKIMTQHEKGQKTLETRVTKLETKIA